MLVVNIIIGLYGTPAVRQAVLRLAWYRQTADSIRKRIGRPIRFEIRFERKKWFAGPYFFSHKNHPLIWLLSPDQN